MTTYTRPELNATHERAAAEAVTKFFNNKSTRDIRLAAMALILENARLTLEVNEHRAARGFDPLPVFRP